MANEPIEPCPFCRGRCEPKSWCDGTVVVKCLYCDYTSNRHCDVGLVIKSHNRVSRACQE